jgi:hypothetical protein
MQAEEILDALEEYLGQYVGGTVGSPGKRPTKATSSNYSCRLISRAMYSPQALLRSLAVPFGTNSLHGISLRTPHRNRSNS